jgi:hypothetical protein
VRLSHKDVPNRSKSREYISSGSFGGLQRLCLEFAGLGIFVGALLDGDSGLNSRLGDGFVRSLLKIT